MSWTIGTGEPATSFSVTRLMDENDLLLDVINSRLAEGEFEEAAQYQMVLQRNLIYLMRLSGNPQDPQTRKKS